jgi:hypothetical protein
MHFCWLCLGYIPEFSEPYMILKHKCICDKVNGAMFWTGFTVATVVALPVLAAATVVAAPPAFVAYAASSAERKKKLRVYARSFISSL